VLFESLDLLQETEPLSAPLNMAVDEVLLARLHRPLLRVYRWVRPAVSFGCFEKWSTVVPVLLGRDAVRRWTGGGIVVHGDDFTYSLMVPSWSDFFLRSPVERYHAIHRDIITALATFDLGASLSEGVPSPDSRLCFEKPVSQDVLLDGRKIAGGAQRRTRHGLLHQGSIQGVSLPERFAEAFAQVLSSQVFSIASDGVVMEEAGKLAAWKYADAKWLRKY
jgi:lipoate-protein ligase A